MSETITPTEKIQNESKEKILTSTTNEPFNLFIDINSNPEHENKLNVNGNAGLLGDILVQLCEDNENLILMFEIAVENFYLKYPEKRENFY